MIDGLKNFIKVRTRDDQYTIAYRKKSKECLYDGNYNVSFKTMRPTLRYWYADPIINQIKGHEYLYCEMYDVIKKKGAIGISYRNKYGKWSRPKKILGGAKSDQHLSFPIVIYYLGAYYMFPCIGNGVIQVYKMGQNEQEWSLWSELFDDHYYVDPVFENIDGNLYMISGIKDIQNPQNTKLSVNEILDLQIKDRMRIRPAIYEGISFGNSERNAGKLLSVLNNRDSPRLRVTQESDKRNGYGNNIQFRNFKFDTQRGTCNEVLFYRVETDRIISDIDRSIWYETIGPHTYSQSSDDEIIDLKIKAFSPVFIWRYIIENIRLLFAGR